MSIVGTYSQVVAFINDIVDCLNNKPKFIYFAEGLEDWVPDKGSFYFVLHRINSTATFGFSNQPSWSYAIQCLLLRVTPRKADISPEYLRELDEEAHASANEFILKLKENTSGVKDSPIEIEPVSVLPVYGIRADIPYGTQIEFNLIVPDGYCFC